MWPNNAPTLLLADPDAIKVKKLYFLNLCPSDPQSLKEVALNRPNFPKPVQFYTTLSLFGRNIVASEHDEWRKHRKVASPAFNERNSAFVFQETTRVVLGLLQMWEERGKGDMITIPDMTDTTFELALQVIASAAFGYSIAWKDEDEVQEGHRMVRVPFRSKYCRPDIPILDVQGRSPQCLPQPNTEDDLV